MRINYDSSDYLAKVLNGTESDMFETRMYLTHIIDPRIDNLNDKRPDMTTEQVVNTASMSDREVAALCGFVWVPEYGAKKSAMCQICVQIATMITLSTQEIVRKLQHERDDE
jgi:hypothetical protein